MLRHGGPGGAQRVGAALFGFGKAPVAPQYLSRHPDAAGAALENSLPREREPDSESRYRVVDYCGDVHLYPPEA